MRCFFRPYFTICTSKGALFHQKDGTFDAKSGIQTCSKKISTRKLGNWVLENRIDWCHTTLGSLSMYVKGAVNNIQAIGGYKTKLKATTIGGNLQAAGARLWVAGVILKKKRPPAGEVRQKIGFFLYWQA